MPALLQKLLLTLNQMIRSDRVACAAKRPLPALFSLTMLCAFSAATQAQTPVTPNYGIGDAVREAQPPRPATPRKAPAPEIVEQAERPLSLPAGETLMVREFKLEGAEFIAEAELQAELVPYKGRALNMEEIQEAAAKLTALYRSRGYLVARAYVPKQDATGGVLTIRIIVGKYGKLALKNSSLVGDGMLLGTFAPLQGEAAVSRNDLERAMLLVDDMPGAAMPRLTIAPGAAGGTSDFDIEVQEDKRFSGYLLGDNMGSRYTGKNRLSGGVSVNSPFGFADQLTVRGMLTEGKGLANGRVAYSFPLMSNGLRAEIAAAKTTYELGSVYSDLDATGDAYSFEGALSYPLLRSREENLYVSLGLAKKRLRDEIGTIDLVVAKKAKTGTLGLRHERWGSLFGLGAYSNVSAGLTYGNLDFTDDEQAALNKAGANTAGNFAHLNIDVTASLALAPLWSLNSTLSLQKALMNKNLDASNQMSLTCACGVKAYRETVSGDNGYLFGAEVRYALPEWDGMKHAAGLFADTGRVYLQQADYSTENSAHLSDIGLGYYVGYGAFNGMIQIARGVGPRPSAVENESKTRVLLQLGVVF